MKNRILACLLCVLMLVGMVPVSAFAAVDAATAEAQIGSTYYATLQEAVNAAKNGDTVKLLKDITYSKTNGSVNGTWVDGLVYTGDQSFTIDLGGNMIMDSAEINDYLVYFKNTTSTTPNEITLTNGTIMSTAGTLWSVVLAGSSSTTAATTINFASGIKVISTEGNDAGEDVVIRGRYGSVLNVMNGATILSKGDANYCINVSGYYAGKQPVANIYEGAVITQENSNGAAVIGNGIVNVYGGTIKSAGSGLYTATSGEPVFNVYDGTISADKGAVVAAADVSSYPEANPTINVAGGTINGSIGEIIYGNVADPDAVANVVVTGGSFTVDPTDYLPAGSSNQATENNGSFVVAPAANSAASIGTVTYATLAEAIAAVKDGETVKLLKSVSGSGIDAKKGTSFTLDLGGFTYTANDPAVGSVGTANQGLRFKAGPDHKNPGNVTIKNGKIAVSADSTGVYAVINSYLNLTLIDVTLDGTNLKSNEPWVININNGTLTLNGNTNIIAPANGLVRVNGSGNYSGDTAAVFNTTGTIGGKVIVTGDTKADLAIQNGNYTGTIVNENTDAGSISISGGSFEVKPDDEFIAEGLNKQFAEIDGKFVLITKHTCAAGTEWLTDAENHWHVCTESSCPKIFDLGAHDYVDGKCSVCEYPEEGYVAPAQKPAFDYVLFALAARYSQKFDVLVSAENATVSGDLVIKYKRSGTVDIDVADGYQLVDVIANGQSLGAVESVTFKKVMGPQTLVVVTEPIPAETPTEETSVNP